ncbi:CRP/FNR family transcriptional regulator, anaerobic regulatory protein [Dehalogenimonas formicexedens]|uniref:CRP/FNR family transcriptional regulator, anaerobic regulatory protein n=1 Tax=Dehalogenimonas formicexedens TaxID=1839801 RepID=A0A1P8F7K1_9CHLR|nr:Crp/Fnr family transcriptional regulator [Dehalogenimonas formicexedens]APV44447.1 CRP/FNR family transcriptional regulator, anaerobic regulatory protein [Dehalogenimonas formicexedens]
MAETFIPELSVLTRQAVIRRSPYFTGLSPVEYSVIEGMAVEERFYRDAMVVAEGDSSRKVYLVASGAVKIFGTSADGKEQILAIARPGDSFNDVAAFDGGEAQATAQALTQLVVFAISGKALLENACRLGPLAANIIGALGFKIRQLGELVSDLSFRPVSGRLARILLNQVDLPNTPYLTQRDLAAMAGTAREVVARALKGMEDEGLIRVERHKIEIINRPELEKTAL